MLCIRPGRSSGAPADSKKLCWACGLGKSFAAAVLVLCTEDGLKGTGSGMPLSECNAVLYPCNGKHLFAISQSEDHDRKRIDKGHGAFTECFQVMLRYPTTRYKAALDSGLSPLKLHAFLLHLSRGERQCCVRRFKVHSTVTL